MARARRERLYLSRSAVFSGLSDGRSVLPPPGMSAVVAALYRLERAAFGLHCMVAVWSHGRLLVYRGCRLRDCRLQLRGL